MTDNQLYELVFSILNAGLTARGMLNVQALQAYQPSMQGAPSGPAVLVNLLFHDPVGHPRRGTQLVPKLPGIWDDGATQWDDGATQWDTLITLWDGGASIWDDGRSTWDQKYSIQHVEEQAWQSTFQVNALSIQDATTPSKPTAADILRAARATLQSSATIELLQRAGVGILYIRQIRNTPFVDDRQRNEYNPSFDFALTHSDIFATSVGQIESVEHRVYRV